MILGVDPSVCRAGVAMFNDAGVLVFAALVRADTAGLDDAERWRSMAHKIVATVRNSRPLRDVGVPAIERLVSERPQIYQRAGGKSKADPNDQLHMVGVVGALAALLPNASCTTVVPFQWKGQTPKPIILGRIRAALSPAELAILDAAGEATDPGEAAGVVLRHIGRLRPRRVHPGASPG